MGEYTKVQGVQHITSTPYHPEGNGQAERMVKEIKSALTTMVQQHGRNWPSHLDDALRQLRTCNSASTGMSPHFILYGRAAPAAIPQVLRQVVSAAVPGLRGAERAKQQERIEEKVNNNLEAARNKQKEQYDKRHKQVQWKVGDIVIKKKTRQSEGDCKALAYGLGLG